MKDWIWTTAIHPGTESVFAGCNNGTVSNFEIAF
jgi:intraflagellar transport protein 122